MFLWYHNAYTILAKLQKQWSYQYKDTEHFKHVVVLPEKLVEQIGWVAGQELTFTLSQSGITIKSATVDTNEEVES